MSKAQKKLKWVHLKDGSQPKPKTRITLPDGGVYITVSRVIDNGWVQVYREGDEYESPKQSPGKQSCVCTSSAGEKKQLFNQWPQARKAARKRGWVSEIYSCPTARGYHITKG